MTIKTQFFNRLNRAHNRAQVTARHSTLNKKAWLDQVNDLAIIRRLAGELGLFAEATERKADARYAAATEQAEIDIDQAEDLASAKLIADNTELFVKNDVGTVKAILLRFDPVVFAEAWQRLPEEKRVRLLAALSDAGTVTESP